jgi:riboflavin biosynthesis pyrimidine reductase
MAGHAPEVKIPQMPHLKAIVITAAWHPNICDSLVAGAVRGFNQILVESGPTFGTALLKADLVDEIVLFQAPTFFGSGTVSISDLGINSISQRLDFDIADVEIIGADLKITLVKSDANNGSGR